MYIDIDKHKHQHINIPYHPALTHMCGHWDVVGISPFSLFEVLQ